MTCPYCGEAPRCVGFPCKCIGVPILCSPRLSACARMSMRSRSAKQTVRPLTTLADGKITAYTKSANVFG